MASAIVVYREPRPTIGIHHRFLRFFPGFERAGQSQMNINSVFITVLVGGTILRNDESDSVKANLMPYVLSRKMVPRINIPATRVWNLSVRLWMLQRGASELAVRCRRF
jgi:hypothetical protein